MTNNITIPIIRPTLPPLDDVMALVRPSYDAGIVTCGRLVGELETAVKGFTGAGHAVMLSSCTSGFDAGVCCYGVPGGL